MKRVKISSTIPFILVHLACLAVVWCGVSGVAVGVCLANYLIRMFGITAGYHRYFSHRSFKTGRVFQFLLAWLGCSGAQLGPLWWAAHHRHHHSHSDTEKDAHSPGLRGFLWSHVGWVFCPDYHHTAYERVKDLCRYRELLWLEKNWLLPPLLLALAMLSLGQALGPAWGTSPVQMLVWGFFISTVALYHVTFCVNSLAHVLGSRRYPTRDDSRNSFWLAILTLGEGWHNNHHQYPSSERQGFFWWEVDVTHYILVGLRALGLVRDLRTPPASAYQSW